MTDEELTKELSKTEKEAEKKDKKKQWVEKMIKSAKTYYKICPYYDKKNGKCFLSLGDRCTRDGKFETCPVFLNFLENKYNEISARKKILPMDFTDLTVA
ncbi:hypothetical protein HS7_19060 [Sulfolobales archaeon HS-7]|nr:hypothetical protein HS7_19060 [Sulfolobales archaeon HS-7]